MFCQSIGLQFRVTGGRGRRWLLKVGARNWRAGLFLALFAIHGGIISSWGIVDANGNGISDVWETAYGIPGAVPGADPDGDGQNNLQESIAGTDPNDPQSVFRVQSFQVLDPACLIRWQSVAGKRYQVEATTALGSGVWLPQGDIVLSTGDEVLAAVPRTSSPFMAFRLRLLVDNPAVEAARPALALLDTDGDGMPDIDEYAAGTGPFDATSFLTIRRVSLGKAALLSWSSVPGKHYRVQSNPTPTGGAWKDEGGVLEGTGFPLTAAVEVKGANQFFRTSVSDANTDLGSVTDWEARLAGLGTGPVFFRTNHPVPAATVTAMLAATNILNLDIGTAVANVTTRTPGSFRLTRAGNLNALIVQYFVGGDAVPGLDYAPLTGSVKLPAGANAVEIPVFPLNSAQAAPTRSVVVTLAPDGSFQPGTNVTAEVRVVKQVALPVTDFGAMGDGVTDDTAAIQTAINVLEAVPGLNTLYFPAGTYRLNSPTPEGDTPDGTSLRLLRLGNSDLAGRDLFFVGEPGATLYSTVSTNPANILAASASFRSLTFRGLTWKKDGNPLPFPSNGANGVTLLNADLRRVEAVDFLDCVFENCHGAVSAWNSGYDLRGKLNHFGFFRCRVLNPYGSNALYPPGTYGGGQQVRLNPWVNAAVYADNYFDGAGDDPVDQTRNPGGIRKDGSHYGSPLHLLFTNNIVRHMAVEAVDQLDDPFLGIVAAAFVVPPPDGTSTVQVLVQPVPTTYVAGQVVNFRAPGSYDKNFLTVVGYDVPTLTLTVKNDGLSPGLEGSTIPVEDVIYLQKYDPTIAVIVNNVVDAGAHGGEAGIASTSKATISGNFINGYLRCIRLYSSDRNPLFPPTPGTVIDSNVILTHDSHTPPMFAYGIESDGPGEIISHNLIVAPNSTYFTGIVVRGTNSWVEGNLLRPVQFIHTAYGISYRALGIGFGHNSSGGTAAANRTCGFDVGVGPEWPYDPVPHRVIAHCSTNDVLAIDPLGLTGDSVR